MAVRACDAAVGNRNERGAATPRRAGTPMIGAAASGAGVACRVQAAGGPVGRGLRNDHVAWRHFCWGVTAAKYRGHARAVRVCGLHVGASSSRSKKIRIPKMAFRGVVSPAGRRCRVSAVTGENALVPSLPVAAGVSAAAAAEPVTGHRAAMTTIRPIRKILVTKFMPAFPARGCVT
jgi:hypothetical protein